MTVDRTRRTVLGGGIALVLGAAGWRFHARDTGSGALLLAACDDDRGGHGIAGWETSGELRFRIPVAHRAHAVATMPGGDRAVFFARRPGTVSWVVDLVAGELVGTLESVAGRHFYGHGVFSPDGRYLYTTENDYAAPRGVIGLYDAGAGFARVGELGTGGIGPHELALLGDGRTLAVANGGIRTHPDRPREKLNPDTMQPSLAYLDTTTGKVLDRFFPDDHRMSLRHLAVTANDRVVIGVQYEGDPATIVPLMLTHGGEATLVAGQAGAGAWRSHANYIASVAVSADGHSALLTAPRGNTVSLWNLGDHTLVRQFRARDVAGVAAVGDDFYLSTGLGQLLVVDARSTRPARCHANAALHWDNHLALARPGSAV